MTNTPSYDLVADEYYDVILHPTCANFRELGLLGLQEVEDVLQRNGLGGDVDILETGAGRSSIAEHFSNNEKLARRLVIQDQSEKMLRHSLRWQNEVSEIFVSDARQMPVKDNSFDFIFSFLLDPYDTTELWTEVSRVARPGARWVLTSPSHSWAHNFRKNDIAHSRFVNSRGEEIDLPSITYNPRQRIENLYSVNFSLEYFKAFSVSDIQGSVSPKLIGDERNSQALDFFVFYKDS